MFIIDQFKVKYKFSRLPRRQYTIFEERTPKKTQLLGQHFSNIANRAQSVNKCKRAQIHRKKDRLEKNLNNFQLSKLSKKKLYGEAMRSFSPRHKTRKPQSQNKKIENFKKHAQIMKYETSIGKKLTKQSQTLSPEKTRNYFLKFPTPQNSPILQHTHADTKFLIKRSKMRPLNQQVTQLSNRADISSASMLKICLAQYFQQSGPPGDNT